MSKFQGLDGGFGKLPSLQYRSLFSVPSMTFPHFLSTKEMTEWVVYHFEWDRRGVVFPSSLLPKDFPALCPSYELAVAEEATGRFKLPELPQVIFYAMLLNEAERMGVLHERTVRIMESAFTELRWTWFRAKAEPKEESSRAGQQEEDLEAEGGTTGEKRQGELGTPPSPFMMAFPPLHDTREMADFRWRRATRPPRPLLEDYQDLRLRFSLPEAKEAALDFGLPEMVTFHTMLLNDVIKLGIVSGFIVKSTLVGLRWTCFEAWMSRTINELRKEKLRQRPVVVEARGSSGSFRLQEPRGEDRVVGCSLEKYREKNKGARERMEMNLFPNFANTDQATEYVRDNFRWALRGPSAPGPRPLPLDYRGLCPRFDLEAIFYAMVVDDAAELGLSRRLTMDCMMWAMGKLDWGPIESWLVDIDRKLKRA
ncbi:LOW QUALITY PROTEIN: hypothetical protein Cgig2_006292 [Carnegiea gigantea]|uniref:Uncharacterized protein n=1 Tax=Carnegiea gigantea TaxID=171969 RepID=A0A9Q1QE36_9CARY|nr:LOW QUALITY PROTEIN: hypothetical protein Cgig2_006292 [Carnegiea gigantea]